MGINLDVCERFYLVNVILDSNGLYQSASAVLSLDCREVLILWLRL